MLKCVRGARRLTDVSEEEAREEIAAWRDLARRVNDAGTAAAFEMCADYFEDYLDDE